MHPELLHHLVNDRQTALRVEAVRARAGRPTASRPRRRWRGSVPSR